jgi:flagellar basal-body rod protein FlgB
MQIQFLNLYNGVMNVREERASLVANNIANADTPGFKAQDVSFDAALASQLASPDAPAAPQYRAGTTVALDGNDVSLDGERIEAAQNAEQLSAAAAFLHQSTADLITALRPSPSGN